MKKNILTILLIVLIIFGISSIVVFKVNYSQELPKNDEQDNPILEKPKSLVFYGYNQLDEVQQKLYDFIELRNFKNNEEYYFEEKYDYDYIVKVTELYNAAHYELCSEFCYRTIMEDYPEDKNKPVQAIGIAATDEFLPYDEHSQEKKVLLENKVKEITENIPKDLNKLEQIQYIYDYVINNITYDKENLVEDNGNAYGGLIIGKAICQGYAYSFEMIAKRAGFNVITVHGTVGMNELSHAWNMIEFNGNWYHLDATWDDSEYDYDFYSYFMLSDEEHRDKRINNINDYSYKIPVPKAEQSLSQEERDSIKRK